MLRSIVSGGWADQDAELVGDLLEQAHELASLVVSDDGASAEVHSLAADFLERLRSDTLSV